MNWVQQFPSIMLRCALMLLMLSLLATRWGEQVVHHLLPWYKLALTWLDDTYQFDQVLLDREGADQVIRVVVRLAHCVILDGTAYCGDPRGRANASTLAGHVLMPAVCLIALVLSWPADSWLERALRLVLLCPALCIIWFLDVPFVLWAALWHLHVDAFAPDTFSPLLSWSQFLESGGRMALVVLGALGVLAGATRLAGAAVTGRLRKSVST